MHTASVMKSGGSAVVTIPADFRARTGIRAGDKVEIFFPDDETMAVRPVRTGGEELARAVGALEEFAQRAAAEWDGTGHPEGTEEIRDVLEERYV